MAARRIKAISAVGLFVLSSSTAALAQTAEAPAPSEQFRASMNHVFGPGHWRETSGYRTREREDELRREGAGTVPLGQISHHSMGAPDAPGAYDVVVEGMSTQSAAEVLRRSDEPFARVIAERAHGAQGSHLHIEPGLARLADRATPQADPGDNIYLRVVNGRRNPLIPGSRRMTGD
jgi:hypothetical protein